MPLAATRQDAIAELFATPSVVAERRADGSFIVRSTVPLGPIDRAVGVWLERWAAERPDQVFLAERIDTKGPWSTISYGEARKRVRAAAGWMIAQRMSAERPLAILSDNAVEHAILALGAMHAGIPVATISSAYSLVSKDFEKLRAAIALLDPGAIYVSDAAPFAAALAAIKQSHRAVVVAGKNAEKVGGVAAADILATPDSDAVSRAFAAVGPDTIAKFLFTSGSTGAPKAVINTHGMLTSNQAAKAQVWPFLQTSELVVLDWLPWSHTFGANHNFNMVLRNGGTLYIDQGKPAPGLFTASLDNLRSVIPTVYFNVPRGFDMLIVALREDEALRRKFFENVRFVFYAAAALPQNAWDALEELVDQDHRPRHPDGLGMGLDRDGAALDRLPFPCRPAGQHRRADPGHRIEACCRPATSSKCVCAGRTSRRATGRRPSSPQRRSTRTDFTGSATR